MPSNEFALNDLLLSFQDGKITCRRQSAPTSEEMCTQVETITQSQKFIQLIVIAILLSYYATTLQKKELFCAICQPSPSGCRCLPDTFPFRLTSSILVLIATTFFFLLSHQALCVPFDSCTAARSASYNNTASLLVLVAAVIRIIDLITVQLHT